MSDYKIEVRGIDLSLDDADKCIVTGKAIVFDTPTVLYTDRFGTEYKEVIDSHALEHLDLSDVPLKYNHSKEKADILARVRDKSLTLDLKKDGLYFTAELRTNLGQDVYTAIKAGDINKCSFGFHSNKDSWDSVTNTRTILDIDYLSDISIVDDPAYTSTYVQARDYYKAKENLKVLAEKEEKRKKLILLSMM